MTRIERLGQILQAIPPMIGLQIRRMKNPFDILVGALEAIAPFVPVISIPAWAYANGRATVRLGKTAETFYADEPGTVPAPVQSPPLLGPPTARTRRHFVWLLVVTWLVLGALAAIIPLGRYAHFLPLAGRLLAEVGLLVAVSKIFLATRPFAHLASEPAVPGAT